MGWVLGLGFSCSAAVFSFLAAPLPTAWPIRAGRFPLLFIEKKNSQGPDNPKTEEKKKKTARDRTTLKKKKKPCTL